MTDKTESVHKTVLLNETIEGLNLSGKSVVVDCTFGGGGHSAEICKKSSELNLSTKIIALDQDQSAFEKAKDKLENLKCEISFVNANFGDLDKVLAKEKITEVDGIIFDLGLSSDQLDNSGRGFSFMRDEPLIMTMKANPSPEEVTAYDVVNTWGEENLADIIYGYGEERYSRRIAKAIVDARGRGKEKREIKTTFELVEIIKGAVPSGYKKGRINPATKTFQALRIAVNDELGALQRGLDKGFDALKVGGRISVISFHSLEDRIVKRFFKQLVKDKKAILINKKPIVAESVEVKNNPRSRSAKLRIIEKTK